MENWILEGSYKQESFDTSNMRTRWIEKFPTQANYLSQLPNLIDRPLLRKNCELESSLNFFEKFLAVMVWGYGDRGYGPYRIRNVVDNEKFEMVIREVVELSNNSKPLEAYNYLNKERLLGFGPSYGTKLISFCTPREMSAPILDSYILTWINSWATQPLLSNRKIPKSWDEKFYAEYAKWIDAHASKYSCYPDDVELVLFRDAELMLSKASGWRYK